MIKTLLTPCLAAAALALPLAAQADVYTIAVEEKIFGGLGACDTPTLPTGQGACDGMPPVEINQGPSVNPNWPSWGIGLPFDLLRLQALNISYDTASPPASLLQGGEFAVGQTGGGSAGPCCGSLLHPITLQRTVVVAGNTASPYTLVQTGTLEIGWVADTLTLNAADLQVTLPNGSLVNLRFNGIALDPVAGDPPFELSVSISAVPEAPALALFGTGLAALLLRARRAVRVKPETSGAA